MYKNGLKMISAYVRLDRVGNHYYGKCPICENEQRLFVVDENGIWNCLTCGKHGDAADLISTLRGITKREAERIVKANAKEETEDSGREDTDDQIKQMIYRANRIAEQYFVSCLMSDVGKTGLDYFRDRKLSMKTIKTLGLGYSGPYGTRLYDLLKKYGIPDEVSLNAGLIRKDDAGRIHDAFWNRVIFPIRDGAGRTIAFGGRVLDDSKPKYLNTAETPVFSKRNVLYGLYAPGAYSSKSPFVLCEGYMDVISMYQDGIKNAVATLGTALTSDHAELIRQYTRQVMLSYDSDGPGLMAAERAIPILKEAGVECGVINFAPCKDPDEFAKTYGKEALKKRLSQSEESFMFLIRRASERYDLENKPSLAEFIDECGKSILGLNLKDRGHYVYAISKRYDIPAKSLWALIDINDPAISRSSLEDKKK